jgi:hypothetical protein
MPETVATTTPKASENVKLNSPKPFTGKRSDFILFMQDVFVYLKVNKSIYDDDERRFPSFCPIWQMETLLYRNNNLFRQRLKRA